MSEAKTDQQLKLTDDPLMAVLTELRADLFRRANELGARKYDMYGHGVFTGYANALDPMSPLCSKTEAEAREWHALAVRYLDEWPPEGTDVPAPQPEAQASPAPAPLTDAQIEQGRRDTFSTDNPFCPCDSKTMRKAVRWAERALGIGLDGGDVMRDDLGDRMKLYEGMEAGRRLMPRLPVLARIDGRAFHSFTRGMSRPYDADFSACMIETTIGLVRETGACMGYTQSDEITLAWHAEDAQSQIWFDGRVAKMTSQLAAQATLMFYRLVLERIPQYAHRLPTFDARVWSVPNRAEGANVFLWREWDATKNSITMAAAAYYSHKELMGQHGRNKHDMLHAKGVNWNDYPVFFKRGTYVQRRRETALFTAAELDSLPPKHAARTNPGLVVERSTVRQIDMPIFSTVTNRAEVVFDGAEPIESGAQQ